MTSRQCRERKYLGQQSMTNCTGHYIGSMAITLMELRLIPAYTWEYTHTSVRCIVVITDFRREKLSSPIRAGAGNQGIFNSRERKSRCGHDCNPRGRSAQREQFRIARLLPWRPVCTEVLTNRSRFRIRNGAIYARLEKRARRRARMHDANGRADVNPASVIHYSR